MQGGAVPGNAEAVSMMPPATHNMSQNMDIASPYDEGLDDWDLPLDDDEFFSEAYPGPGLDSYMGDPSAQDKPIPET